MWAAAGECVRQVELWEEQAEDKFSWEGGGFFSSSSSSLCSGGLPFVFISAGGGGGGKVARDAK